MQHRSVLQYGITGFFIAIFIFSAFITPGSNPVEMKNLDSLSDPINTPLFSTSGSESPIIGVGDNQTIRVDMQNSSSTQLINQLNITTESDNEYLSYGQFNFSLPKSYNTNYTLEDDNSLDNPMWQTSEASRFLINSTGNVSSDSGNYIDINQNSIDNLGSPYINFTTTNNVIVVNLTVNYSLLSGKTPAMVSNKIIGFLSTLYIGLTVDALMNISMYDWIEQKWNPLITEYKLNKTIPSSSQIGYNIALRNENLHYFNKTTNNASFSFLIYNNTESEFDATLDYVKINIAQGHETALSTSKSLALEFDIKGKADLHGFYVWLRTKNSSNPINLTATVVGASNKTYQQRSTLLKLSSGIKITPDFEDVKHSENFTITTDKPTWYSFNKKIENLTIGNYFIILESNNTDVNDFSLVTLPDGAPDSGMSYDRDVYPYVDHLLLNNQTTNWDYCRIDSAYSGYIYDAAPFSLNITRGWMATELNLSIFEKEVDTTIPNNYNPYYDMEPVEKYRSGWWGLGTFTIERSYETEGIKAVSKNFSFTLNWNDNLTTLEYELNYTIRKYIYTNATSIYVLNVNQLPQWNVTYEHLNAKYPDWNITNIGCLYPNDWDLINAYDQNNLEDRTYFKNLTLGSKEYCDYVKFKNIINSTYLIDGNYTYIFNSPNYISEASTNLNYKDNLWETSGFMRGDNISISIGVVNPTGDYMTDGFVNISIYNPNNQLVNSSIDNDIDNFFVNSWYDFGKTNIYNTTNAVFGNYSIVSYWTNRKQAGIIQNNFYIGNFSIIAPTFSNNHENNITEMTGLINIPNTNLDNHDIFYFVSDQLNTQDLIKTANNYLINQTMDSSIGYDIVLKRFAQNETIFNGGEKIKFEIDLENTNLLLKYNVSVVISVVSSLNEEWVIANASSEYKLLNISGASAQGDYKQFDVNIDLPTRIQGGLNCPIRQAPVQVKLDLKINDIVANSFVLSDYFPFIDDVDTVYEGNLTYYDLLLDRVGRPYLANIPRSALNLPGTSEIFINVFNDYGMGALVQHKASITDDIYTRIENFTSSAISNLDKTSVVTLTGKVLNEKGVALSNIQITFDTWNISNNLPLSLSLVTGGNSINTDINGCFSVDVAMKQFDTSKVIIRAKYAGNSGASIVGFNQNLTLYLNEFDNNITLEITKNSLIVNSNNLLSLKLINNGNSTLENITLKTIGILSDFHCKIYSLGEGTTYNLAPGESVNLVINLWNQKYDDVNATVIFEVSYVIVELQESKTSTFEEVFNVNRTNESNIQETWIFIGFLAILASVWVFGTIYCRKQYIAMNMVPESVSGEQEGKVKGTKTGKYINLGDLSPEKQETVVPKEEKGTNLDDLIKEEGLEEDK